ncbi:hypothetical protein M378DRAFT_192221 [Amanita muscaria Koide BX008]|uniref:BSD domain-containing protein n=1 Tax=Amanita muscaria (strain Koide BX008) TaxID=946122 RepID=A0A0C2WVY1_AMAMK|nr:hypothetical protein M378DRAFT_192221 [Amanita muscaria Koide BX008]
MPTLLCTAKASYKKSPGVLGLSDTHLQWTQDGKNISSLRVPYSEFLSLFCSKEGAPQVRLKIGLKTDEAGHNFTFLSDPPVAYTEREKFKKELTNIISRNRSVVDPPPRPPVTASANVPPATVAASLSNAPTPKISLAPSRASTSRAASVSSDQMGTPVIPGNDHASDFRLRKKVLLSNPDLAVLHKELVISGQISEAEFWEGREHLLLAQAAADSQKKGKPGQIVDPRPETVEGGEIKIRITPQLIRDIFDEYPVVEKAHKENVPTKLTEEEFWRRYFQSKLFNAHRASIRSSAAQHVVKDDPIFDKYLEKDDDDLEPRRARPEVMNLFLNLGATQEDHIETGNEKDVTMQAGKQKGALPLIRKFNEHSERLLKSALGDVPPAKRRRTDEEAYFQIELTELNDSESSAGIILEMQDRQRYFEAWMATITEQQTSAKKALDVRAMLQEAKVNLQDWNTGLQQLKVERKLGEAALLDMTQNVSTRLDVRSRKNNIPDGLFKQMASAQTSANEFLRQYWSSIYPPLTESQNTIISTPSQRTARASKMIGYITHVPENINMLKKTAEQNGIDPRLIETAMKPTLTAVETALAFNRTRRVPRT